MKLCPPNPGFTDIISIRSTTVNQMDRKTENVNSLNQTYLKWYFFFFFFFFIYKETKVAQLKCGKWIDQAKHYWCVISLYPLSSSKYICIQMATWVEEFGSPQNWATEEKKICKAHWSNLDLFKVSNKSKQEKKKSQKITVRLYFKSSSSVTIHWLEM